MIQFVVLSSIKVVSQFNDVFTDIQSIGETVQYHSNSRAYWIDLFQ